jgi:hypothetical protein
VRLSLLERSLLYRLAVEREPVTAGSLATDLGPALTRTQVFEGLAALSRRSLIEVADRGGSVTLQPAVREYVTDRLLEEARRDSWSSVMSIALGVDASQWTLCSGPAATRA